MTDPVPSSQYFRTMADVIDHNADKGKFGGAAVIVPPSGGGEVIELFMLRTDDQVTFWKTLSDRIKEVLEQHQHDQKMAQQGGFRR